MMLEQGLLVWRLLRRSLTGKTKATSRATHQQPSNHPAALHPTAMVSGHTGREGCAVVQDRRRRPLTIAECDPGERRNKQWQRADLQSSSSHSSAVIVHRACRGGVDGLSDNSCHTLVASQSLPGGEVGRGLSWPPPSQQSDSIFIRLAASPSPSHRRPPISLLAAALLPAAVPLPLPPLLLPWRGCTLRLLRRRKPSASRPVTKR